MKKYTLHSGFTLIELIISIAIFGIIMISVIAIFLFSSQMSTRVELNRLMQENIKNVFEDIAENVRKGEIDNVLPDGGVGNCTSSGATVVGTKLCLQGGIQYSIGYYDDTLPAGPWHRVHNIDDCKDPAPGTINTKTCHIIKNDGIGNYYPLTNSFVSFTDIQFIVTNDDIPKVLVSVVLRPAVGKGLAPTLLEINKIEVQTTLSERLIETK